MSDSQPASANRAVFLSYASQDAEAARRICDSLRAGGVEVWFDADGGLEHGDEWDAKIRRQIKECVLFIPVISASSQARHEGYFRIEWELAAQRALGIASGVPFILPVVIDDTREPDALVPDRFRMVQWTKLRGGEVPAEVQQRFLKLWSHRTGVLKHEAQESAQASILPSASDTVRKPALPQQLGRRIPVAAWITGAVVVVASLVSILLLQPKPEKGAEARPPTSTKPATAVPKRGAKSIVVLPFENLSDDKEISFADGMQEDVITNLLLIRELSCVPRATAMTYRSTKKTMREIADELGVAHVLTGTVRRADKKVRITGTLINARTDEAIWTKSYDKELTDIFGIQSELAQAIAAELKATLSPEERSLVSRRATEDPVAYDLFLKARQERNNATGGQKSTLDRQIGWLEAAVARDPSFATAWAFLGRAYGLYYRNNHDHSAARLELARNAIDTALRLAPDAPEVLLNVGDYYVFCFHDHVRATDAFEKVARLQPNSSQPWFGLANVQREQGKWLEAWVNYQKTTDRDPAFVDGWSQLYSLALAGRRFADARTAALRVADLRRMIAPPDKRDLPNGFDAQVARLSFYASGSTREIEALLPRFEADPHNADTAEFVRVQLAAETGNDAEVVQLDRVRPATDAFGVLRVATALINLGRRDDAVARIGEMPAQLRSLLALQPDNDTVWGQLSRLEAVLGHKDEALRCARERVARIPLASDHWRGTLAELDLAFVYTWTGDTTKAIEAYAQLLSAPVAQGWEYYMLTVHTLKRGVWYAPLRGDPRFEALIADPKNNALLF